MPNLNHVALMGNVTRQIEVKYSPKGTAIADVGLAINRAWKDDQGNKHEETTFVDLVYFGKSAELLAEYVKKGDPLYCSGRLTLDSWDDKATGQKRTKLKVTGEDFQFLPNGRKGESTSPSPSEREATVKTPDLDDSDDIPM